MTCHHVSDEKKILKISVGILYLVYILYPVCSLHLVLNGLVLLFLFERASSPNRNIGARKKLYWDHRGRYDWYVDRKCTGIEQWLFSTNWRRTQMCGLPLWPPLMLFRVVTTWVEMNPLRVLLVWTFRLLDSSCIFRGSEMLFEVIIFTKPYKYFISFHLNFWASSKLILTFTKWGGVACKTTSVHGPQCNFRPRNTSSVHGRQLPSTSAPPRYLIHCFPHESAKNESMLRADNKTIRNGLNHIPALKQKLFRNIVLKNYESVKFFTGFPELWSV